MPAPGARGQVAEASAEIVEAEGDEPPRAPAPDLPPNEAPDAVAGGRALAKTADGDQALGALAPLLESARRYAEAARAVRTRREYDKQWRAFVAWCDAHDLRALPAAPETVALYLSARADQGKKVSTIAVALSAIAEAHRLKNLPSPRSAAVVRETWKGIKRKVGCAPRRVAPVEVEVLRAMIAALPTNRRGLRDRAIMTLGFAGAFRRSELVELALGDVAFTKDGLVVTLRRSKTDQEGQGTTVGVPFGGHPDSCPVRTLRAWLDARGHSLEKTADRDSDQEPTAAPGERAWPLFVSVSRHDKLGGPLDGKDIARLVKRAALAAGLDPRDFSGHSLRAGLATAAAKAGKPDRAIMRQGRWRSRTIMDRYVREGGLFRENAAAGIGL